MNVHEIHLRRDDNGWKVTGHGREKLVGVSVIAEFGGEQVPCEWHKPFVVDFPACDENDALGIVKDLMR
jgi:hypothetical protein